MNFKYSNETNRLPLLKCFNFAGEIEGKLFRVCRTFKYSAFGMFYEYFVASIATFTTSLKIYKICKCRNDTSAHAFSVWYQQLNEF